MSPYALSHLPAHLTEATRWDELASLLRDLPFLEAKAGAGYVFGLVADFTRAVERMPGDHPALRLLWLISQALRADIQFLAPSSHHVVPVSLEPVLVVRLSGSRRPL